MNPRDNPSSVPHNIPQQQMVYTSPSMFEECVGQSRMSPQQQQDKRTLEHFMRTLDVEKTGKLIHERVVDSSQIDINSEKRVNVSLSLTLMMYTLEEEGGQRSIDDLLEMKKTVVTQINNCGGGGGSGGGSGCGGRGRGGRGRGGGSRGNNDDDESSKLKKLLGVIKLVAETANGYASALRQACDVSSLKTLLGMPGRANEIREILQVKGSAEFEEYMNTIVNIFDGANFFLDIFTSVTSITRAVKAGTGVSKAVFQLLRMVAPTLTDSEKVRRAIEAVGLVVDIYVAIQTGDIISGVIASSNLIEMAITVYEEMNEESK